MLRITYQFGRGSSTIGRFVTPLISTRHPQCQQRNQRSTSVAVESQSFMMNVFRGHIKEDEVFPFKEVLNEEQRHTVESLIDPTEKFLENQNDPLKNDLNEEVDKATMTGLMEMGAFGLQVPEKYGGLGLNNTQTARLNEIIGANDLSLGIMLGAHQSIGFKGILLFGTEEQKTKYLPPLAAGKKIAAFCLTEPTSGSDANSIRSRAVLSEDKKHYVLSGNKIWISNGGIADVFTVFAQTPVTNPETGTTKDRVSAFIVERSFGGVTSGPPEKKMGIKASNTAEVHFDEVKVPRENLLGAEGEGFKVAMNILNNGRFGLAAALTGTMRSTIRKAVEFATSRVQFGKTIDNYGVIQEKIARMTIAHYVTESLAYTLSSNMDRGVKEYQLEAAISKVFSSDSAWFVTDEAIQILGGMGFMRASGVEKVMRDLRVFRIFEGTNDILRLFIALTGIQYAGNHLKQLQKAMKNPGTNLGMIFGEGSKRALKMVGMASNSSLSRCVHPEFATLAGQVSGCIDQFGGTVESLLVKHGKNIVDEQFVLSRLGSAAIDIYAMVVVMSRASRSLNNSSASGEHEALITKVFCEEACERVKQVLGGISDGSPQIKRFDHMAKISRTVLSNGGLIHQHPVGF